MKSESLDEAIKTETIEEQAAPRREPAGTEADAQRQHRQRMQGAIKSKPVNHGTMVGIACDAARPGQTIKVMVSAIQGDAISIGQEMEVVVNRSIRRGAPVYMADLEETISVKQGRDGRIVASGMVPRPQATRGMSG